MSFNSEKNKREKDLWVKTSPKLFGLLINSIKFLTFLCCCGLLYGVFGDSMKGAFDKPKMLTDSESSSSSSGSISDDDFDRVVNGIHVKTGLAFDENFQLVRGVCTACHSAKLITQNRATYAGWKEMIVWMQATQGLQDLGEYEKPILAYLAKHYAPEELGRRASLDIEEIEWYILDLE